MLAVVFVPRRFRVVWTPGMPSKRKGSRRNRYAPVYQITPQGRVCQGGPGSGGILAQRHEIVNGDRDAEEGWHSDASGNLESTTAVPPRLLQPSKDSAEVENHY